MKYNLMLFRQALQSLLAHPKLPKPPLVIVVKNAIMLILMFYAQSQYSNVEKVLVESCDETIGKENDNLKLDVKRLEQKVSVLEKQAKAQPSQDNRRNMVNKLEKEKTVSNLAPQQQMKATHHKKEERANIDEKIEYARSILECKEATHQKWHWLQKW
jgi:hypothetical protein